MPKHILFFEDDRNIGEFVAEELTAAGFTYDWYENPREAFKALEENPKNYDAIVSDWNMPARNGRLSFHGIDVLRKLRRGRLERFNLPKNMPFAMCSGYDCPKKIEEAQNAGANFYQHKTMTSDFTGLIEFLNNCP